MNKKERETIETYNKIAVYFNRTRNNYNKEVREFIETIEDIPTKTVVDIGCGNGRYFKLMKNIKKIGVEPSEEFIRLIEDETVIRKQEDILNMSIDNESVDYIICTSVLHHLMSEDHRREGIKKITEILRPGGRGIITVFQYKRNKYIKSNNTDQEQVIKWYRNNYQEYEKRYCYFFKKEEIENMIKEAGLKIISMTESLLHWNIIVEK